MHVSQLIPPSSFKPRLIAAGFHFLASTLIFSLLLFIIITLWYPQPHFSASGGWQGLIIVALVDLVLGPCLTLIIYNTSKPKKELLTDLSLIILLQVAALSYGVHTVYTQRPAALVFWEDKFYTVPAAVFDQQKISLDKLKVFSTQQPALIYAEKPHNAAGLKAMLVMLNEQQRPPFQLLPLYRPLNDYKATIFAQGIDIDEVIQANADMAAQLQQLLAKSHTQQADNIYLVLESKYQNIILVFNTDIELLGFLKAPYK